MDSAKPLESEAPELSPRSHDDGPIVAATYKTHDRFEFTPEEQQREKLDRIHSGFSPVGPQAYPPQYNQYQNSSVLPSVPLVPTTVGESNEEVIKEKKRKRWVGWTLGLIFGVLAALGAGIGIGYAIGENVATSSKKSTANSSNSNSTTVTSGATGIAAFSCSRDDTYASPFGASFAQDCYVSYKTNQTSYDNSSIIVRNFAGITVYSFEQCMDQCQQRNLQLNIGNALGDKCVAVSYYANLTYSIPAWAGNCFLKNARGMGKNWDTNSNASLTASGYLVTLS